MPKPDGSIRIDTKIESGNVTSQMLKMPNGTYWWCERGEKISPTRFMRETFDFVGFPFP